MTIGTGSSPASAAPVGSFLILITAFVIVIGPVNYFLLRRKRRLYLLLVTVPLGAALVTLTLFAYALISDGLGVRVRMRSFTEIDQRAGRSVSWSRQSYYAGLAPSGGLTFPETVAVFPIEQYPAERQQGALGTQWLVWGEQQNLATGYISSRSAAQFLVVESGPSSRRLLVESGPGDAAVWRPIGWIRPLTSWSSRTSAAGSSERRNSMRDNGAAWTRSIRPPHCTNCDKRWVPILRHIRPVTIQTSLGRWGFAAAIPILERRRQRIAGANAGHRHFGA